MKAKVLKLDQKLFDGEVDKVVLPALEGEMCLLPHHISIITSLKPGTIKIFKPQAERFIAIVVEEGVCSFSNEEAVFILNGHVNNFEKS
ncbi:MAG: F0F1 ATP synthase subunit epsilon [Holosporaceae bacterium]|nr:F0F1 ATP synthase subunit epsilon [Holosporaceae bacterium]